MNLGIKLRETHQERAISKYNRYKTLWKNSELARNNAIKRREYIKSGRDPDQVNLDEEENDHCSSNPMLNCISPKNRCSIQF